MRTGGGTEREKTAREDESTIERERGTKNRRTSGKVGGRQGNEERRSRDRETRGGGEIVEENARQGRGTPWANVKRQRERGLAERRDEKLDLQICPDYYEIARLPSRDAQPVLKCAFR